MNDGKRFSHPIIDSRRWKVVLTMIESYERSYYMIMTFMNMDGLVDIASLQYTT